MLEKRIVDTQRILNGVNVNHLVNTVNKIKDKPELAKFRFRAKNRWIKGGHNRSTIKEFYGAGQEDTSRTKPFVFDADEPPVLLGEDKGANPMEYVLHALAACLTTSLIYHAIYKKSLFDGLNIGKLKLCVKTKTTTRCRTMSCASFERKLREVDQEENNKKFKTDKGNFM